MAAEQRIGALIRIMREAEQELQALTGGQLDAVAGVGGQPFLLHDAQEKLRQSEGVQRQLAETQIAILDALPAHIALVNCEGQIISVNGAWRRFAGTNALQGAERGVGQNYLTVCERARGKNAGLRALLSQVMWKKLEGPDLKSSKAGIVEKTVRLFQLKPASNTLI
jgi:PAS domain-containing protein